jgi:hypothetical protein
MTPVQAQAQLRIEQLLCELAEVILGDVEHEPEPSGPLLLREWAVVGLWVDDAGDDLTTVTAAAGMRNHHVTGLLGQAALDYGQLRPIQ